EGPNANEAGSRRPRRTPQLNQITRRSPEERTCHCLSAPEPASLAAWRADQVHGDHPLRGRLRLQTKMLRKPPSLRNILAFVAIRQQIWDACVASWTPFCGSPCCPPRPPIPCPPPAPDA